MKLPHSSRSAGHDEPDDNEHSNDPANNADESYNAMPASLGDSPANLPGDQPDDEQDTPPPLGVATGTQAPE